MPKHDPFAMYNMPLGLTEGVEIPLPQTPAVFTVVLPGTMNEEFNMDLMAEMNLKPDDKGVVRADAVEFNRVRKRLFFERCIVKSRGLPKGMDAAAFFDAYPLAARSIFESATKLAAKADTEVNAALGKSESSPSGNASGEVNSTNTMQSLNKESTSRPAAPN